MSSSNKIKDQLTSLTHFSDAEKAVYYAGYLAADNQTKEKIEAFLTSQKIKLDGLNSRLKNKLDSATQEYLNKVQNVATT